MDDVKHLIKKYGTNDPFKLASYLGVGLIYEPLGSIYGYYNQQKRIKMIHINNALAEIKQHFVCAHELGHVVRHPDINTAFLKAYTYYSVSKIEVQANEFATNLLTYGIDIPSNICVTDFLISLGIPPEMARFI